MDIDSSTCPNKYAKIVRKGLLQGFQETYLAVKNHPHFLGFAHTGHFEEILVFDFILGMWWFSN